MMDNEELRGKSSSKGSISMRLSTFLGLDFFLDSNSLDLMKSRASCLEIT